MKSLKELQCKQVRLIKIHKIDLSKLGPNPYGAFHELGPLNDFDFHCLPHKIIDILADTKHDPTKPKT